TRTITLSLHDALPISRSQRAQQDQKADRFPRYHVRSSEVRNHSLRDKLKPWADGCAAEPLVQTILWAGSDHDQRRQSWLFVWVRITPSSLVKCALDALAML